MPKCGVVSMAAGDGSRMLVHMEANTLPDEELVRRLSEGRGEALDALHQRYASLVMSLAARQLGRSAGQEIVQDVFVSVWRHAQRFDSRLGTFRAWILQIARRRIINELRQRRSRPVLEAAPEGGYLERLSDDFADVAAQVANDERRSTIRDAVRVLPVSQRRVITLAFMDELTHAEVSKVLSIPLGTTKTRIRGGLSRLRVELAAVDVAIGTA
jgi:RNA polymerase sigma-70 factor (ECF subfamily)